MLLQSMAIKILHYQTWDIFYILFQPLTAAVNFSPLFSCPVLIFKGFLDEEAFLYALRGMWEVLVAIFDFLYLFYATFASSGCKLGKTIKLCAWSNAVKTIRGQQRDSIFHIYLLDTRSILSLDNYLWIPIQPDEWSLTRNFWWSWPLQK